MSVLREMRNGDLPRPEDVFRESHDFFGFRSEKAITFSEWKLFLRIFAGKFQT